MAVTNITDILVQHMTLSTPLGDMVAAASDQGICLLGFTDGKYIQIQIQTWVKFAGNEHTQTHLQQLRTQLTAYFAGERTEFKLYFDLWGTVFQRQVWQSLLQIPYGQTWFYAQQAEQMNRPRAIRAVATANARNPLSILVPCHRVIAKNGQLAGYAGQIWRKQWLLDWERKIHD